MSKVAAEQMLQTTATSALMCVPTHVGRQQQSVLRCKDCCCMSVKRALLCSWQQKLNKDPGGNKIARAERRQENTRKSAKRECPGGCPCCVIVRQPCGSALHKLHRQPCAQVASYVMVQGVYIEITLMQFTNGFYLGFSEPVSLVEWETGFGVRPAFAWPLPTLYCNKALRFLHLLNTLPCPAVTDLCIEM